jgi:hypothetical protein
VSVLGLVQAGELLLPVPDHVPGTQESVGGNTEDLHNIGDIR